MPCKLVVVLALAASICFFASCRRDDRYLLSSSWGVYVPKESSRCETACQRTYEACQLECPVGDLDCLCDCRPLIKQCRLTCPGAREVKESGWMASMEAVQCPPRTPRPPN